MSSTADASALLDDGIGPMAAALRAGAISPVALCTAALARIEQLDPHLHAFRLVCAERAIAAAAAAEREIAAGRWRGPLHGIPYATKDLFDVAGLPTTAGSRALTDHIATRDATVTRRLAEAGMILIGKTHTVEFAFGSVGINHSQGTPHNPWARVPHVPGGSSSGSAVAVAAGLVPLATGTDTACSVRTPAALCGVVGLKTTVGRVSRAGVYPLSTTLDSVGPIGRRVSDVAHLFMAMQGSDAADPTTRGIETIDVLSALEGDRQPATGTGPGHPGSASLAGVRIGIAEGLLFEDVDPEVERAVRATACVFRDLGAQVRSVDFAPARAVLATPNVISLVEGHAVNRALLEQHPEALDPVVRERMLPGAEVRAIDYRAALMGLEPLRAEAAQLFADVDVLLAPTCALPAAPTATVDQDFPTYMHYAGRYLRNCVVGNLLNLCAVSLPCGFTAGGLPIGLMLQGGAFREDTVLRVAHAFEQATPWHRTRPDLRWIGSQT